MDTPSFPAQPGSSSAGPIIRAPSSSPETESAPPKRSPSTEDVDVEEDGDYQPAKPSKRARVKKAEAAGTGERVLGTSLFPLARVQKIMKADKEMPPASKEAVFLIAIATEEFVKRLVLAGHQVMKRDNRSTMQHKDLAAAVRRHDELNFLDDILPETIPASRALAQREALLAKTKETEAAARPEKGSTAIEKAFERGKKGKGKGKGKANAAAGSGVDDGTDGTDGPSGHLTPVVPGSRNTSTSTTLAAKVENMAVADDEDADMEDA